MLVGHFMAKHAERRLQQIYHPKMGYRYACRCRLERLTLRE